MDVRIDGQVEANEARKRTCYSTLWVERRRVLDARVRSRSACCTAGHCVSSVDVQRESLLLARQLVPLHITRLELTLLPAQLYNKQTSTDSATDDISVSVKNTIKRSYRLIFYLHCQVESQLFLIL